MINSSQERLCSATLAQRSNYASPRNALPMRCSLPFVVDQSCSNRRKRPISLDEPPPPPFYESSNRLSLRIWPTLCKTPISASGKSSSSSSVPLPKRASLTISPINWVSGCNTDGRYCRVPTVQRASRRPRTQGRMPLCAISPRESWKKWSAFGQKSCWRKNNRARNHVTLPTRKHFNRLSKKYPCLPLRLDTSIKIWPRRPNLPPRPKRVRGRTNSPRCTIDTTNTPICSRRRGWWRLLRNMCKRPLSITRGQKALRATLTRRGRDC